MTLDDLACLCETFNASTQLNSLLTDRLTNVTVRSYNLELTFACLNFQAIAAYLTLQQILSRHLSLRVLFITIYTITLVVNSDETIAIETDHCDVLNVCIKTAI